MTIAARPRRVAVVGAGITGLLLARRLTLAGLEVVVLESGDDVGGQIRTVGLAGRPVDVGAEALHLAAPGARTLLTELGLTDDVITSAPGSSRLWTSAGLRPLPAGVGPAGPTRILPVLRSGVLTPAGLARAGLEPLLARARRPLDLAPGSDVSVGAFTSARFGRQVTARFVDPLLGGLHSGDVDRLSLRACVPSLVPAATSRRSLVLRRTRVTTTKPTGGAPGGFATFAGGLTTLVRRIQDDVTGPVRTSTRVTALETAADGGYVVHTVSAPAAPDDPATADVEAVDAVVLAVPAREAGRLLSTLSSPAAAPLVGAETATTAAVVVGFRRADVATSPIVAGTGLLVPSEHGGLLKAVTNVSTKWPHLDRPDDDVHLLRLSAGRAGGPPVSDLDDDTLVARLLADLARYTGIDAAPTHVFVQRWAPGLPQLTVGHPDRIDAVRTVLARELPGVHLAGAAYDGVGLTSCIASAERVAADVLADRATDRR